MTEDIDPTGLIFEAYRIDGITEPECRSIFVDWALKLSSEIAPADAIRQLLDRHAAGAADHPMTAVLKAGLEAPARPKRRGGRKARIS